MAWRCVRHDQAVEAARAQDAATASVEGSPAGADLTAAVVAAADAGRDNPKVPKPPLCGLHRVDTAVQEAYGTLAGTRTRKRPLPKQMRPAARSVGTGRTHPRTTWWCGGSRTCRGPWPRTWTGVRCAGSCT
ncbi:hypothetical protein ACIOJ9_39455, partial [Streptomyces sp. NPDC088175]|uniref:hypothetical protein n=1 Tax=unclassified Streptomyces TaxID=2593676 RepID=UPI003830DB22